MNKLKLDILYTLFYYPYTNKRELSEISGHSLGVISKTIKVLKNEGYLDNAVRLTSKSKDMFKNYSPKNAIILAAGFGMRMVPINTYCPKALIKVKGEKLIERIIKHLHDVEIYEIYIVVGFMKERFNYLIDEYGVQLIVNEEYTLKNNLHSLALVSSHISNTYIIPCDIWCYKNPFHSHELYSWYMVSDVINGDSSVRVNRKMELVSSRNGGNEMIGIAYLVGEQSKIIREKLKAMDKSSKFNESFWEEALYENDRMMALAKVIHGNNVIEINTYEQLRELDEKSEHLKSDAIDIIAKVLNVSKYEIVDITFLKKGMTNRSFLFSCRGKKYIMRIPGEGTEQLINRREEAQVYNVIKDSGICDNIAYINPKNGYKITEFLEGSRVCDPDKEEDLKACMKKLKELHNLNLVVEHEFDIFRQIDFYESLWNGAPSIYRDYNKTKKHVLELKKYIDNHVERKCLTHIDAVPDNFLLTAYGDIHLIDWEYAGMQDPHVDIAMFCIYSLYNKCQIDRLIGIYFDGKCKKEVRVKIYCYIAVCGLLWSNWCEYKRSLGVEFGEYSLRQYQYAKDYYNIVMEELSGRSTDES